MQDQKVLRAQQEEQNFSISPTGKKHWQEPKLVFVEPKLTKHGNLEELTGQDNGFFGPFSP